MIKTIQNWLDVRKQYKLEQQRQELISVAKVIISDIMRELVKYDIECSYYGTISRCLLRGYHINYGTTSKLKIALYIYPTKILIEDYAEKAIATYEHLQWYQLFTKKSTKKKFYHAEDAVKAISNMIIMGEAI